MNDSNLIKKDLEKGDIVILYSWEYLQEHFEHELDNYGNTNGNLISKTGHRSFIQEQDKYGKPYYVNSVNISEFWGVSVNCIGKKEICANEIMKVVKKNSKNYQKIFKQLDF